MWEEDFNLFCLEFVLRFGLSCFIFLVSWIIKGGVWQVLTWTCCMKFGDKKVGCCKKVLGAGRG